jgi:hypothetical protein
VFFNPKKRIHPMAQTSRISKNNTTIRKTAERYSLVLHSTEIASVDLISRVCTVDHGGYPTATTRTRLAQFFREKGIDAGVSTHKGEMLFHRAGMKIPMDTAVSFKLSAEEISSI